VGFTFQFLQIHLAINSSQLMNDVQKLQMLKDSQQLRLDILSNLLFSHLGVVEPQFDAPLMKQYTSAYLLGSDEVSTRA
jgi:hypothetical protein